MTHAPTGAGGRRRVVRAPNHLGDVVMAIPALRAHGGDVMVRAWLAPVLAMAGLSGLVIPLEPGWVGWRRAVATLRRTGYREGTLLTPSFSAAWLFRWGGVARLRGTASDGRSILLSEALSRKVLGGLPRIDQYRLLLGQEPEGTPSHPRLVPPRAAVAFWRKKLDDGRRWVALFPGSNASARRWPADRFAALGRALQDARVGVVVLGGASERELTAQVARGVPGALDGGGKTDLPGLAAVLSLCDAVVTNDTGPLHLAAAVGAATVSLWGSSDPDEVAPAGPGHARVGGPALPCRPCRKNECPRRGRGIVLARASNECMHLIEVDPVLRAASALLERRIP